MQIRHRDELRRGGFAGLKETRMVMNPQVFGGGVENVTLPGLGRFVDLAFARFLPHGLSGLVYWYAVLPFHGFVFSGMLKGIRRAAMATERRLPTDKDEATNS